MQLPTLYKKTSTGKIQEWTIEVLVGDPKARGGAEFSGRIYIPSRNEAAQIITRYGQTDGVKQTASDLITQGKNIGKANETTPFEQAQLEAKSQWEKKLKKGYVENIEDAVAERINTAMIEGGVSPMLAQSFDKHGHKIRYPAFVQPKLDGHRCIAVIENGVATLWSRTRKRINSMPHIVAHLEKHFAHRTDRIVLDGELYNHDYREKFEELTGKIRASKPVPGHEIVQYFVYDVVTDDAQNIRILDLEDKGLARDPVVTVPSATVGDEAELFALLALYLEVGFEGLMVRNSAGRYVGKRSYDLQKVKVFQDAEFKIVDVEEGRGKMAGKAIFVCETDAGKRFNAKMVGNLDALSEYFINKDRYIGRQLTVKFQKLSAEGIPVFPVAMRLREDV